jgi:hypothetical protein
MNLGSGVQIRLYAGLSPATASKRKQSVNF